MSKIYVGLLHYPVYNKEGKVIATSVTNLDIHDIARLCMTYDVENYFIIQPDLGQKKLVSDILNFWQGEQGKKYNRDRFDAMARVVLIDSLEDTLKEIEAKDYNNCRIIVTDAKVRENAITYDDMRQIIKKSSNSYLILFGTGWGIEEKIMQKADYCLEPIVGADMGYNHLSVRSAAAIIIDRLLKKY